MFPAELVESKQSIEMAWSETHKQIAEAIAAGDVRDVLTLLGTFCRPEPDGGSYIYTLWIRQAAQESHRKSETVEACTDDNRILQYVNAFAAVVDSLAQQGLITKLESLRSYAPSEERESLRYYPSAPLFSAIWSLAPVTVVPLPALDEFISNGYRTADELARDADIEREYSRYSEELRRAEERHQSDVRRAERNEQWSRWIAIVAIAATVIAQYLTARFVDTSIEGVPGGIPIVAGRDTVVLTRTLREMDTVRYVDTVRIHDTVVARPAASGR